MILTMFTARLPLLVACCAASVLTQTRPAQHDQFWKQLLTLCGQAFEGRAVEAPAGDETFTGKRLVAHVRLCAADEIRIPLHVGDDRSRTWVVSRTPSGLRLKHDHRHEDGSEDKVTQYGGDTAGPGTAERQEFAADAHTAELIPAARTNVWTLEHHPERLLAYALRREGTDRRFRLEFDTTRPVPAPPPPWGHRSAVPHRQLYQWLEENAVARGSSPEESLMVVAYSTLNASTGFTPATRRAGR